jgi:hypothetical protein
MGGGGGTAASTAPPTVVASFSRRGRRRNRPHSHGGRRSLSVAVAVVWVTTVGCAARGHYWPPGRGGGGVATLVGALRRCRQGPKFSREGRHRR